MAASSTTVGDAFLSAPIQTMIDKLTSTDFQDYANNNKLSLSLVTQSQTALLALAPVLDDAEKKQIHYPGIRKWLDELKDAIFDAEDLLNQISYDSLRCKVRNPGWNFLSSLFNTSEDFNSQLKTACERLQLFAQQIDNLGLQTVSHKVLPTAYRRSTAISSVNESFIVGRENDKQKLIKMLLSERDNDKNNLGVVAIVGIGGLGKTTLAKLVYSDFRVKNHFDLKAWASVSLDFDILEITRSLLKTVTLGNWDTNDLHILRAELKKNLRGKRFLFVLDDVWERVYDNWIDLVSPFVGKSGSKVIITTRNHSVATMTGASHIHTLGALWESDSWSLLLKDVFAFGGSVDPMLEYIGQSIARKCGGLPLALKALAGLLRTNLDAEYWDAILNSDIWDLPANDVMPALHVSYQYLPSHLKRCFTYCSIFPKDYPLDRKQLVLLWMAEGLVEKSLDSKEAEKILGKSQVGLSIKELRKFQYLRGKLTILNLHNVIDSMEAFAANLNSKQRIEELVLQWGEQTEYCEVQLAVLDMLQPSITLKKLSINYYSEKIFPSWLGDSSFSSMVYLSISNCEYCRTLPPLGQLSSLKDLRIDGMKTLKTIGPEFYGMVGEGSNSSFQPFPSLQNLQFRNMSSWKEWLPFEGGKFPFPCLQTLRLRNCPELRGHLPNHPPSIKQIVIIDCGRLLETPSTLHSLSSLENKNIVYLK
ncbi:unnamed protein product [Lathyrus sativus]|nr:unnamed protein product [Lathyrus sativus]